MIGKKIHSEDGATILIAIIFFLLCSLAGATILASASASSGRIANLAEQEQAYYTVTSAAQTLRDEIGTDTVVTFRDNEAPSVSSGSRLDKLFLVAASRVESDGKAYDDVLTINTENKTGDGFDDVQADFVMGEDYEVSIVFYLKDESMKDMYQCTLDVPGAYKVINKDDGTAQVSWSAGGTIRKGVL